MKETAALNLMPCRDSLAGMTELLCTANLAKVHSCGHRGLVGLVAHWPLVEKTNSTCGRLGARRFWRAPYERNVKHCATQLSLPRRALDVYAR